jgi:hypothetical protein
MDSPSTIVAVFGSAAVEGLHDPPDSVSKRAWLFSEASQYVPVATHDVIVRHVTAVKSLATAPTGLSPVVVGVHVPLASVSTNPCPLFGFAAPSSPTATHELVEAHHTPLSEG